MSPLIEMDMTEEEMMESSQPAPKNKYKLLCKVIMPTESPFGEYWHDTKSGGKMLRIQFEISDPGQRWDRKALFYNATQGAFSLVDFKKAYPEAFKRNPATAKLALDTDGAEGQFCLADVIVKNRMTKDEDGKYVETDEKVNEIKKLYKL